MADRSSRRDTPEEWHSFIRVESHILGDRPTSLFQHAANQPASSPVAAAAATRLESGVLESGARAPRRTRETGCVGAPRHPVNAHAVKTRRHLPRKGERVLLIGKLDGGRRAMLKSRGAPGLCKPTAVFASSVSGESGFHCQTVRPTRPPGQGRLFLKPGSQRQDRRATRRLTEAARATAQGLNVESVDHSLSCGGCSQSRRTSRVASAWCNAK
jgi:hypothetical protein